MKIPTDSMILRAVLGFLCAGSPLGCTESNSINTGTESSSQQDRDSESQWPDRTDEDSGIPSTGSVDETDGTSHSTASETDTGSLSDTLEDTDTAIPDCVRYVKLAGAGAKGLTWGSAFSDIGDGIESAAAAVAAGALRCEVWVAGGVYYIFKGSMNDTLQMRAKVDLYGGFAGDEALRGERDVLAHLTVLDGHKSAADFAHRVIHVLHGEDDALLDGFVVTGGYAAVSYDPADRDNYGAGMLNEDCSPTVRNTWFVENEATWDGAVACFGKSTPRFESCVFSDNLTGGLFALNSSPVVERCLFTGNRVSGLVANGKLSQPVVTSSVFAGNRDFGVETWYGAKVSLEHCTIAGCFARPENPLYAGGVYAVEGRALLRSSVVFGNEAQAVLLDAGIVSATYSAISGIDGEGNSDADPSFVGLPLRTGGTWDKVSFDAATGTTHLRDADAAFDGQLAGRFLQPSTDPFLEGGPVWVPIAGATSTTLTVVGDVSWLAAPGDAYALFDLNLDEGSIALGAADPQGSAPADATGKARDKSPDMGAYER
ncbi:MAG: right-handed parallel beta-helix repeat-containing protein [Myxococcota bacterium]|jgi:hypothetical protein|nr:right-handed parallel beta-helix repeat-containing protein [Myxococcota bacterium]